MTTPPLVFLDTNILVYQFDHSAPAKQSRAKQLIEQCLLDGSGVISSQVLQEFVNVALSKFAAPLSPADLQLIMNDLLQPLCQHTPTYLFYERALSLFVRYSLSFYDALIIQAALDLGCKTLYSEDLQTGQTFSNLKIVNPFS